LPLLLLLLAQISQNSPIISPPLNCQPSYEGGMVVVVVVYRFARLFVCLFVGLYVVVFFCVDCCLLLDFV
jgi:hypothetical protein